MATIVNQFTEFAPVNQISVVISAKNAPKIITICRNVTRATVIAPDPLAIHVISNLDNVNAAANLMGNVVTDARTGTSGIQSVHVSCIVCLFMKFLSATRSEKNIF